MPTTVISSVNRPTFIEKPNMRFANTMLSTEYRDYAVNGENIIDKVSGELFIKRPTDSRVISFSQNKKYLHDLVLELRVLLTNNQEVVYPRDSESAYYISTDYDLVAINNEKLINALEDNPVVNDSNDSLLSHKLKFNLSTGTNAFFCRPTTRDIDKLAVEYITNLYNTTISNYNGSDNADINGEKEKFINIETWKDSNVVLNYFVTITGNDNNIKSYNETAYVRVNEEVCVYLPYRIKEDFPDGYKSIVITISTISYDKLQFVMNHKDLFPNIDDSLNKFLSPDKNIYVNYLNIMSFVDSSDDINLLGNENIIAILDMPYVLRYMGKLAKLHNSSEFIQSTQRPDDDMWTANTVWAEHVSDALTNNTTINRGSETNIKLLEEMLGSQIVTSGIITTDSTDTNNFYLSEESVGE